MKKIILIPIISIVLIIITAALINFFPVFFMKPIETGKIGGTEIYALKNNIGNIFLIKTDDGYIAIDAGMNAKTAEKELKDLSIDIKDIKNVFLTHSDYDHTASLSIFTNAKIFISEDEIQMIDGSVKRNAFGKNSLPSGININSLTVVQDRQKLTIGKRIIECIKLPGHTLGSAAYLIDGKYLFTGDAAKIKNGKMTIHPFTMDKEKAKSSIEKTSGILKDKTKILLTSHYGYSKEIN